MENNNEQIQQSSAQSNINVKVDPETFLEISIAKNDHDIAEAEFIVAQANLKVFELKRIKSKAIVDYHYRKLKQQQELQAKQAEMTKQQLQEMQTAQENLPKDTDTVVDIDNKN